MNLYLYMTTIYLFAIFLHTYILIRIKNCWVGLYNDDLQTMTVFFTHNFTEGWLNSYYSLRAFSWIFICLFICLFVWSFLKWNVQNFAFSRILLRLHCCLCICIQCLLLRSDTYLYFFSLMIVVVSLLDTSSMY